MISPYTRELDRPVLPSRRDCRLLESYFSAPSFRVSSNLLFYNNGLLKGRIFIHKSLNFVGTGDFSNLDFYFLFVRFWLTKILVQFYGGFIMQVRTKKEL